MRRFERNTIIVVILLAISLFGVNSWALMILLGAVHSFITVVPALGFWQTVLLQLLLSVLSAPFRTAKE